MFKFTSKVSCDRCGAGFEWTGERMHDNPSKANMLSIVKSKGWEIKYNKVLGSKDLICNECLGKK